MATNKNLHQAKKAKNDEFYTRYEDIAKEVENYFEYDPNVFRDKTILCPCDYPDLSQFGKYFEDNFERFGLKKLIICGMPIRKGDKPKVKIITRKTSED